MSYELTPDNVVNFPRPPINGRFQKELTRVAGKNEYGKPLVRLTWGPEETRIAFGQVRKKYLAAVLKKMTCWEERTSDGQVLRHKPSGTAPSAPVTSLLVPIYETTDIGKPRWFLEEWWPPELSASDWEDHRYKWEHGIRVDVLGPRPNEGLYRSFRCIQTEDGKYREPNDEDLQEVRQLLQMRDAEKKEYGNREVQNDKKAIATRAQEYTDAIEEREEKRLDKFEEELKEKIRPHLDKLVKNAQAVW